MQIKYEKPEPWNAADATYALRAMAQHPAFSILYRKHALERMTERGLIVSDVLFVLKNGFVYKDGAPARRSVGYWSYEIQGVAPNSNERVIRLPVIPSPGAMKIKVLTVMWVDEFETRAGTIMEESPS